MATLHTSIGVALVAMLATLPLAADAQGKRGPRASVDVATVCGLDTTKAEFTVQIRVRDKTSGSAVPLVTAYDIKALAKTDTGNWDNQEQFAWADAGGAWAVPATITQTFSLCVGNQIKDKIAEAKGLNAMVSTSYSAVGGGETRTVMNMCSDDLATPYVVEPAGIKLSANDLAMITSACALK